MMALLSPIQPQSLRNYVALPILCVLSLAWAWGCTSSTEVRPDSIRCPSSLQTTVSPAKPTVNVFYTEPTVTALGKKVTNLAKTTIYYDLGEGRRPAKEVPATKPAGGGQISETISVPIGTQGEQVVRICVTATDRHGNESVMTP